MKFLAFLRDSYREAVDGFVIYVMLGLSALVIILAASLSFTPAEPDKAFAYLADEFPAAFRNRGADKQLIGTRLEGGVGITLGLPCEYTASEVQRTDAGTGGGTYKLRLTAKPGRIVGLGALARGQAFDAPNLPPQANPFRAVVAAWAQQPMKDDVRIEIPFGDGPNGPRKGPRGVQAVYLPDVSEAEMKAVTDDIMADFLRNQFLVHGGMTDVTVKRLTGVAEPQFLFDVEVRGGSSARGWPHATKALFGAVELANEPLGKGIIRVEDSLVNGVGGGIAILVTVIFTAFFIPNLMRKGSIDLILSKPVSRGELLVYKYVGGLTFMLLVSAVTIGGVWLVVSLRSGYWNPVFLLSIPMLTFSFAILYALSTLLGVLTRNAIVCILLTALFMALLWGVGQLQWASGVAKAAARNQDEYKPTTLSQVVDVMHAVLPRYNDADAILSRKMADSIIPEALLRTEFKYLADPPAALPTFGVSLVFITLMLLLAYWRFATRDG